MARSRKPLLDRDKERFASVLTAEEELTTAGLAVHLQTAERYGRGQGEGVLAVSSLRILFSFDSPLESPYIGIPFGVIIGATSNWVPYPGMRGLAIISEINGQLIPTGFYAGKHFVREIVEKLGPPN